MELNSLLKNFKGNSSKIITFILIGILLLIIVMPEKKDKSFSVNNDSEKAYSYNDSEEYSRDEMEEYTGYVAYYEDKLKDILEKSYGKDSMEVMISLKNSENTGNSLYGDNSYSGDFCVDGVLIVADIKNSEEAANISFAVCALFNLPAHKVAVLIKK